MSHFVTLVGDVVDVVYLYDPRPSVDAIEAPDTVFQGWRRVDGAWTAPVATIDELRTSKVANIETRAAAHLAIGAPVSGELHVAIDDGSRADLASMATTAAVAATGDVSWPESYARGWITIENARIPLATPAAGLALAASVGDWYARIIQHRRDLKDQVLAAVDEAALDAIDITAGWPA